MVMGENVSGRETILEVNVSANQISQKKATIVQVAQSFKCVILITVSI